MLTKEEILAIQDIRSEVVDVPEWNGQVRIAEMTGTARDQYERTLFNRDGDKVEINDLRAKLVAFSLVDEEGNLVFAEHEIIALGMKSAKALERVFKAANRLNATGIEGLDEAAKE